ncbi:probable D-xylulose reductase A [Aspergillus udagawae]|nr:probable D-xylulose reductase A [Aspergillus udagawae]
MNSVSLSEMQNPSCFLYGPFDARFEDRPIPKIEDPSDVVIRIAYTGVCGSDVHFWLHGGVKRLVSPEQPIVMGHEASGIVHAVGPSVSTLQPGDHVAIEPGYPCHRCPCCKSGRYNLCPQMKFAAAPPSCHGTLTKYFRLPADYCYKIPPGTLGLDEAVLMEPLAVAVHSVRQVGVRPGHRVVVFGAGTVGLLCAAVAREFGARTIITVDVNQAKLQFARSFLASEGMVLGTFVPDSSRSSEENAAALLEEYDRAEHRSDEVTGFDIVIEATVAEREIVVKGCFRYGPGDFRMGLQFAVEGRIPVRQFITRVFPFESATEAWETTRRGEGIKALIEGVQ